MARRHLLSTAILAAAFALPVGAQAQQAQGQPAPQQQNQQQMRQQDQGQAQQNQSRRSATADVRNLKPGEAFAMQAASTSLFEVRSAELAMKKSQNAQVKELAQTTARDHQNANQQLIELSGQQGLNITHVMNEQHAKQIDQLESMQGAEFDRAYVQMQIQGHQRGIQAFQQVAQSGDAPFNGFASQALPTLQQHLQMAQRVQQGIAQSAQAR